MQRIDPILGIIICKYQWRRSDVDALIEEPGEADNAAPDNAVPGNVVPDQYGPGQRGQVLQYWIHRQYGDSRGRLRWQT
jgi:hypothetical protein